MRKLYISKSKLNELIEPKDDNELENTPEYTGFSVANPQGTSDEIIDTDDQGDVIAPNSQYAVPVRIGTGMRPSYHSVIESITEKVISNLKKL